MNTKLKYLALWQRILNESENPPNILKLLGLVKIILFIPVQTATLEGGFSLMKIIKSDWRSRLQPKTLTQLMRMVQHFKILTHFMQLLNGERLAKGDAELHLQLQSMANSLMTMTPLIQSQVTQNTVFKSHAYFYN